MGEPYYIGGQPTYSPNTVTVIFPYTGEAFAEVCIASMEDQARAANCARQGFAETKSLPAHRRAEILRRVADKIEEERERFVDILIHESGKTVRQAHFEVTRAVSVMRTSAEESVRLTGKVIPLDKTEAGEGYTGYYYKVPSGPVLCITP
ncbi:MAG TPA: aldehyde dehydrogenase family protein, partial [Methanocorpusculum sp.]|nr:aldehyde dehydrogenase family protein [Methanocorpusculum sp.]